MTFFAGIIPKGCFPVIQDRKNKKNSNFAPGTKPTHRQMKQYIIVIFTALLATISSDAQKRYELNAGDFTELIVNGNVNVDYHTSADSAGYAVYTTTPDIAPLIEFSITKGKLTVSRAPREDNSPMPDGLPTVRVYSRFLVKAENSGDSTVRIMTMAACPNFNARVIGNGRLVMRDLSSRDVTLTLLTGRGTIVAYGSCTNATLKLTGVGSIQADGLKAANVTCTNTGTGTIGCWATDFLKVKGAGSGHVYYKGTPQVKKGFSLGVKVNPLTD